MAAENASGYPRSQLVHNLLFLPPNPPRRAQFPDSQLARSGPSGRATDQESSVLIDGLVRVPPDIKNPAGYQADRKGEWIEFLSSLYLGQGFILAPNYR
jgi:hypothetical protein